MKQRLFNLVMRWIACEKNYDELTSIKKISEETINEVVTEFVDTVFFYTKDTFGIKREDIETFKKYFKVNSDLVRPEFEKTSPWELTTSKTAKNSLDNVKKGIIAEIKLREIQKMKMEAIKKQSIEDIGLQKSTIENLKKSGINHVVDITNKNKSELKDIHGVGKQAMTELENKINELGLFIQEDGELSKEEQILNIIDKFVVVEYKINQELDRLTQQYDSDQREIDHLRKQKQAVEKKLSYLRLEALKCKNEEIRNRSI